MRSEEHTSELQSHELPYRIAPGAPGSISFVPGAAGLALAGEIIREIAEVESK